MQRTSQQKTREAADRIRCDECGEQRTCTPLMAKACLKGFIRGYVEAKKLSNTLSPVGWKPAKRALNN